MVLDEDWQLQFALFFSLGVAIQEQLQTWLLLFCHQTKYSLWLLFFFSFLSFHLCFCQLSSGIIFACKLFSYRWKEKNNCYDLSVGSFQHKCHRNPCAECLVQAGPSMAPLVWILWPSLDAFSSGCLSCLRRTGDWFRQSKFCLWPSIS